MTEDTAPMVDDTAPMDVEQQPTGWIALANGGGVLARQSGAPAAAPTRVHRPPKGLLRSNGAS